MTPVPGIRLRPIEDGDGVFAQSCSEKGKREKLFAFMRMVGKAVVVTGASGIAAAGATRLAREGARVLVLSRDAEQCAELVGGLKVKITDGSQST